MPSTCIPCQKSFLNAQALVQHERSPKHGSTVTDIAVPSPASDIQQASQLVSDNPHSSASHEASTDTQAQAMLRIPCTTCDKTFKTQAGLNQHILDSDGHVLSINVEEQGQISLAIRLSKPSAPVKDALPPATTLNTVSLESSDHVPRCKHQWSTISESDHAALHDILSDSCHTQYDLASNKYRLPPSKENTVPTPSANQGAVEQKAEEYRTFAESPLPSADKPVSKAIALDCEMVKVVGPKKELVLVCAIDYLTGAVLMNRLVAPTSEVIDWKTRIHGISESSMAEAVSSGNAVTGWEEARAELWQLIDQETILVGHALQHDLKVLHMIHTRVVDSAILTCNEIGMGSNQIALKTLTKELLDVEIRNNDTGSHDALEDVLATRELILWCTRNAQKFSNWGVLKRAEIRRKEEDRIAAKAAKKKPTSRKQGPKA